MATLTERIQDLVVHTPGVQSFEIWTDGVEIVGSLDDSDEQVAFVTGSVTVAELRRIVGNRYEIIDHTHRNGS